MSRIIELTTKLTYDERQLVDNNKFTKLQLSDSPSDDDSDTPPTRIIIKNIDDLPEHQQEAVVIFQRKKVDRLKKTRTFMSNRSFNTSK